MKSIKTILLAVVVMVMVSAPVMGQVNIHTAPGIPRAWYNSTDNTLATDAYVPNQAMIRAYIAAHGSASATLWGQYATLAGPTQARTYTIADTSTTILTTSLAGTGYSVPVTPAPADTSYSGAAITCKNGEAGSMALGDVVYFANGGTATAPTVKFAKADAVASGLYPAVGMVMATITTGSTGPVLLSGFVQNTGWSALTIGNGAGSVWLSITGTTGNTWTQTEPVAAGNISQYLGCAVNDAYSAAHTGQSKTMYFNPSPMWVVK